MGAVIDGRLEEAERLRDYFEVQLLFAETLAIRTACTLSESCLKFTNLHRQLGLGRTNGEARSAEWTRYATGLERCASLPSRVKWTVAFFVDAQPEESTKHRFGCFSYELQDPDHVVRIHFSNRDSADGSGPLVRAKADRRISELREMFGVVRAHHHSSARTVRGSSWLYNLEAYHRLFPPEYAASTFEPERVRLDGMSSWGQVLDFRGLVKPAIRQSLLENIERWTLPRPGRPFPCALWKRRARSSTSISSTDAN